MEHFLAPIGSRRYFPAHRKFQNHEEEKTVNSGHSVPGHYTQVASVKSVDPQLKNTQLGSLTTFNVPRPPLRLRFLDL